MLIQGRRGLNIYCIVEIEGARIVDYSQGLAIETMPSGLFDKFHYRKFTKTRGDNMQEYIRFETASRAEILSLAIYYCQRMITSRTVRKFANFILLLALRLRYGNPRLLHGHKNKYASILKDVGIVRLGNILTEDQCAEIRAHLSMHRFVDSRGSGKSYNLAEIDGTCKMGDYDLATVINCPYVMQIANSPELVGLASSRLGFAPTITGLSIRWSFPSQSGPDSVQSFHRDCEVGSLKVMIYLTDVDTKSAPHTYVEGSHAERMPVRLHTYRDESVYKKYRSVSRVVGRAGTTFAIDTKGLHKGGVPSSRPRLILGIQYSLLPCFMFRYTAVKYLGHSYLDEYINRLIVATKSR